MNDSHLNHATDAASTLVIVPTYRERDNIACLWQAISSLPVRCDLLVIDDGSDDGTAKWLADVAAQDPRLSVIERHRKLGLGTAYTLAFAYARACGHHRVVQMDADLSHDPQDVTHLVLACARDTVVIGSRYVRGGRCENWPLFRYALSAVANWLVARLLGLPIRDATGGFRCTHGSLLRRIPLEMLHSRGFGWQWEFNRLAVCCGAEVREQPICFRQRVSGQSKMSLHIVAESLIRLLRIRLRRHEPLREAPGPPVAASSTAARRFPARTIPAAMEPK